MQFKNMFRLVFLAVYCGLFVSINGVDDMEIGDICHLNEGGNGICVIAKSCRTAVNQIKQKRRHNLKRCGFIDRDEIVCCKNNEIISETETRNTIKKSEIACNEYAQEIPADISPQILEGEDATLGEFPHMAALGYEFEEDDITWGRCGGTLISYQYVLTAAHCVINQENIQPSVVRLGKVDLLGDSDSVPAQDYDVEEVVPHDGYVIKTKANDIALLKLKNRVKQTQYVKPCCLYTKDDDPSNLIIIGWGHLTQNGKGSRILQKTSMTPVDFNSCNESFSKDNFPRPILRSQLCGKSNDSLPRDTCQGDSGGPAQVLTNRESNIYSIVGVTSFGRGCGGKLPSIYTRVSSYVDWIEKLVWP